MRKQQKKHIPPVYVEQSTIHGKGLFASRNIKKGELIGAFKYKLAKKDRVILATHRLKSRVILATHR